MEDEPSAASGPAGFALLVREHADAVFGLLLRRTGDRGLSEDLAQETFLRAWRGRDGFRGESSPRAWLFSIALNLLRDHARRRRRRPEEVLEAVHGDIPAAAADPAAHAEAADTLRRLLGAVAALPAGHREMFLLRERDGLSYAEIAAVMECPIGTVMSGLARARERLLGVVDA